MRLVFVTENTKSLFLAKKHFRAGISNKSTKYINCPVKIIKTGLFA